MRQFYSRRFRKLLIPVIFWSIIGVISFIPLRGISLNDAALTILKIPLQPVIGVYWFIYVMIGLYLFAPVISAFLKTASKRNIEFYLLLWFITLLMPWAYGVFSGSFSQEGNHYWMLNYFGGFLGYWVLGYYLMKYPVNIGWNRKWIIICIGTLIYPSLIFMMKKLGWDAGPYTDNLQFGSAILLAFIFIVIQHIRLQQNLQNFLTILSKYCFGIYLIHYFTRDYFWSIFRNSDIHIVPRTLLIAIITMISCTVILWLIAKLPFGKRLAGI